MPGPSGRRAGKLRDPELAALFSNDDPEQIFIDFREIGHGNFGAVYYARNVETKEIVAIKKMSFHGKQSSDKWQDIVREVKFMQLIRHPNCVEYQSCHLRERDHTAWLVMEYCLGSAADILEVHKKPLREEEIGAICVEVLHGLEYLHSQGFIHRDVKAGNILLTDSAAVKLADFGSASITSPANSFVGTPHWMAPEVILAMDDGQYDGKVDVWSLGITCVELAERKPPLFNMNVMSALYHIGQNEAPRLAQSGDWSDDFRLFVTTCLTKEPNERLDVAGCLQDAFIIKPRPVTILPDLIERTKIAARELDNAVARRFERMLITVAEGESLSFTESTISLNVIDNLTIGDSVGAGSGNDSVGSRSSVQNGSCDVEASKDKDIGSALSSAASLNAGGDVFTFASRHSTATEDSTDSSSSRGRPAQPASARRDNFQTFRTSRILQKQQREHEVQNRMREEMAGGYNRLRRQHQKIFRQTHCRLELELNELKQQLDKEYDERMASLAAQLRLLEQRHERERDALHRATAAEEQKIQRTLQPTHEAEMKQLVQQQKKEYQRMKDGMKKELASRKDGGRAQKDTFKQQQAKIIDTMSQRHRRQLDTEIRIIRRRSMIKEAELERSQLEEMIARQREHTSTGHNILLQNHDQTRQREQSHMAALQRLRNEQIHAQHDAELANQHEYTKRLQLELSTRYAAAQKQVPKNMKVVEQELRRKYQDALKAEEKRYRTCRDDIVARLPRNDQRDALKRIKEEKARNVAMLAKQFENTLAEQVDQQNVHITTAQTAESASLEQRLAEEADQLKKLQEKALQQINIQHQRELKELEQKIVIRKSLLDQKISEEKLAFERDSEQRRTDANRMQKTRLQEFDLLTATAGLDVLHIVKVTEPTTPTESKVGSKQVLPSDRIARNESSRLSAQSTSSTRDSAGFTEQRSSPALVHRSSPAHQESPAHSYKEPPAAPKEPLARKESAPPRPVPPKPAPREKTVDYQSATLPRTLPSQQASARSDPPSNPPSKPPTPEFTRL